MMKQVKTQPRRSRRGVALIVVLGAVTLVTLLVLAFFVNVTREIGSSKQYSDSIATLRLADSAVQLVQAQIFDATLESAASGLAWTSQPGLIRTFNNNGSLVDAYKLYSTGEMLTSGSSFNPATEAPPSNWHQYPARWVDLNEPVADVYPIVDPAALGVVQGLAVSGAPLAASGSNMIPMPVEWLYVLQDGQMAAADDAGNVPGASDDNPITGRIAFWTDDETAKVNINTASEGVYWDVPLPLRVSGSGSNPTWGSDEVRMARSQPWNREYQRYPGHPATTRLSPIFPELFPEGASAPYKRFNDLYTLLPRVAPGGSRSVYAGGTVNLNATPSPTNLVNIPPDRLFSSVEELVFNVDREAQEDEEGYVMITTEMLQERAFMLTASSRSPDLNVFSQPRVSMWPTWENPARLTSFDRLAAFASTIGGKAYYTTRSNPHSRTQDWTPRNLEIYDYLDRMTSRIIPGYGSSFANKYPVNAAGNDRLQLLTQMIDYTRSGVNLVDTTSGATPFAPGFMEDGEDAIGYGMVVPLQHPTNGTWGLGRYGVIDEVGIWFFASNYDRVLYPEGSHFQQFSGHAPATAMRAAILFSVASPGRGMVPIFPAFDYEVQIINAAVTATPISGTGGGPLFPLGTLHGEFRGRNWGTVYSNNWKPEWGNWNQSRFDPNFMFIPRSAHGGADASFPLLGNEVAIPTEAEGVRSNYRFNFSGATLRITIRDPQSGETIQELEVNLPPGVFNYPLLWNNADSTSPNVWANRDTTLGSRLTRGVFNNSRYGHLLRIGDTLKSMELSPYDPRLKVGKATVAAADWRRMTAWGGGEIQMYSLSRVTYDQSRQIQSPEPNLRRHAHHFTRPGVANLGVGITGHMNTGAYDVDLFGHLIRKPDEGDSIQLQSGSIPYITGGHNTGAQDREVTYGKSSLFSPNRQVASPVMFGSLPTRAASAIPNQTLLFQPNSITNIKLRSNSDHPGAASPPDHLMLDLFHMPVVEPYAISEPFSTAGRINLNHQIYPFSYIQRDTGIRAVMGAVKLTGVPSGINRNTGLQSARYDINIDATLGQMISYKNSLTPTRGADAPFLTASEICEIPLVPLAQNGLPYPGGHTSFWSQNSQTTGGYSSNDDWKEAPYNMLYPRLTTRSNTFQVHIRAQSLQKGVATPSGIWVEGRDIITGEYRGSVVLERYIDPNDVRFTNGTIDPDTQSVDPAYRFRTVHSQRFSP